MREKLRDLGAGTSIRIMAQYRRVGGGGSALLTGVRLAEGLEPLCDHLWVPKKPLPYCKEHGDLVVCTCDVCRYQKLGPGRAPVADYGCQNIREVELIRPLRFRDELVYLRVSGAPRYWHYRYKPSDAFPWFEEEYGLDLTEIAWLFSELPSLGQEPFGYAVEAETDESFQLYYAGRNSRITVWKRPEYALAPPPEAASA